MMRTIIVRLLTRISKLTLEQCISYIRTRKEDTESRKERDVEMRNRLLSLMGVSKVLEDEMMDLLSEVNLLQSTYLQNLTELVAINRQNAIIAERVFGEQTPQQPVPVSPPTAVQEIKKSDGGKGTPKGRSRKGKEKIQGKEQGQPEQEQFSPDDTELSPALFYPTGQETKQQQGSIEPSPSAESLIASSAAQEGRATFFAAASLDVILDCWIQKKRFPQAFIRQLGWKPNRGKGSVKGGSTVSHFQRLRW